MMKLDHLEHFHFNMFHVNVKHSIFLCAILNGMINILSLNDE
jgi:hypothetical protein